MRVRRACARHYHACTLQIVTRTDKKRGVLSTGYGFVEFSSPAHVAEALKKHQGMELDGHVLELKFSRNTGASSEVHTFVVADSSR